jgi:hypothetical protein
VRHGFVELPKKISRASFTASWPAGTWSKSTDCHQSMSTITSSVQSSIGITECVVMACSVLMFAYR